jgi:hypothetical protein
MPKRRSEWFRYADWRLTVADVLLVAVLLWCGIYCVIVSLVTLWG